MVMIRSRPLRGKILDTPDYSLGVVYPEWMNKGLCVGADPEDYALRNAWRSEEEIQRYIKVADGCYECPVMIKCGEEAISFGDTMNTIRGGIIPPILLTPGRGRPKGKGGLLKRGVCILGHKILSEEDLLNPSTCIKCHEYYLAHFENPIRNNHVHELPECRHGHEYTDDNIRYSRRVGGPKHLRLERRCATCMFTRQAAYRAKEKADKLAA